MSEEAILDDLQTELDLARAELERTKQEIEEKKNDLKFIGKRDIDETEKRLVDKQVSMTNERNASNDLIEKQKAYDNVMVTGKFINLRVKGQKAKLPYLKYNDDPVKWYDLEDGKVYTIPRGFSDQINGGTEKDPHYYIPQYIEKQGSMDPNAPSSAISAVDSSNKKYAFVPINF